jgi:hypothetical protein
VAMETASVGLQAPSLPRTLLTYWQAARSEIARVAATSLLEGGQ